ncbi:DNA N-glycosylase [Aspergillus rambellii]|uniref:DNA-(apurinic or apyrimidinic site) lyase n=1 Tax=Aspergillus rambellii TaxID=308745 RepID=A0A0F8V4Y4_9EURO|nr:DNA N-glycosylase [Aspergillus rambellii]
MTVGAFSEWHRLPVSLGELCINTTLRCGQSFRWHQVPETDEWRCVLHGRLLSLRQDPQYLYYRTYLITPNPPASTEDDTRSLITDYFNLASNLTPLYEQWSAQDPNFRKKAAQFTGIRILRQDAWEALVSFICSSNNNIARISQMVEKLCSHYGPLVGSVNGRVYHDFPTPEALTAADVESRLRGLGFGYRAKYIYQTAVTVARQREEGWLDALRNPESPALALGTEGRRVHAATAAPGGEMSPEGRAGYREAHAKLLELQGVGPKVADCVCLMGLGWREAVPVDTHVWQIAQRDYRFGKGSHRSLTKTTYDAVGNHFRNLWGREAGWAHSVLFTADLRTFSDRLAAPSKQTKIEVDVKSEEEDKENVMDTVTPTVKTEVTTAAPRKTSLKRAANGEEEEEEEEEDKEGDVKTESGDDETKPTVKAKTKTKTSHPVTRRTSKRLRSQ